jgi:hypothetical protein
MTTRSKTIDCILLSRLPSSPWGQCGNDVGYESHTVVSGVNLLHGISCRGIPERILQVAAECPTLVLHPIQHKVERATSNQRWQTRRKLCEHFPNPAK